MHSLSEGIVFSADGGDDTATKRGADGSHMRAVSYITRMLHTSPRQLRTVRLVRSSHVIVVEVGHLVNVCLLFGERPWTPAFPTGSNLP